MKNTAKKIGLSPKIHFDINCKQGYIFIRLGLENQLIEIK
jgi:hypothetical protein